MSIYLYVSDVSDTALLPAGVIMTAVVILACLIIILLYCFCCQDKKGMYEDNCSCTSHHNVFIQVMIMQNSLKQMWQMRNH